MTQPCAVGAVFLLLMTTVQARGETPSSQEDIVQFWNTSDLIWTTYTTSWEAQQCKADQKVNITERNITFYRAHIEDGRWYRREYNGTFRHYYNKNDTSYDAVRIQSRDRRRREKAREILHYQSKNSSCAVFWTLTSNGYQFTAAYDLRIKDSYIKKGFSNESECWEQFVKVKRGRRVHQTYYENCQPASVEIRMGMRSPSIQGRK
uniref:Lipocalin n=1 Tax=Rhipicephalus zambeziensis TaxID=60191 RepID=A0A224YBW1_9ACAR